MTWSMSDQAQGPWSHDPIVPERILYDFDGPLIFTARFGFFDALFFKFDEIDESSLYLVCQTSDSTISSINNGDLSYRGALTAEQVWIVQSDARLHVEQYWVVPGEDFPSHFLPRRRVGIHPQQAAPDSIEESNALLALTFRGPSLSRKGMPFGAFRNLVDDAHDAIRRILIPEALTGSRNSTLDFEMTEPRFSSLVIALKEPLIDQGRISKKFKDSAMTDVISDKIENSSSSFLDDLDEISTSAARGEISAAQAQEKFVLLDQVSNIIPSDSSRISELAVTTNAHGHRKMVVISEETGNKLLRARRMALAATVVDVGSITQIRGKRNTFVIQSSRGKEITCVGDDQIFTRLLENPRFRYGQKVRVEGSLTTRTVRDLMQLTKMPAFF